MSVAREQVDGIDEPHAAAALAEDDRLRPGAAGEVPNAAQQIAVRDPVPTTIMSPRTRSSIPKMRDTSSMPTSCARRISVRDSGQSWAWIWPPRHCSAAAEITPWDEPPMPTARWSLVPRIAHRQWP